MKVAVIGVGAIAQFVCDKLPATGHQLVALLVRPSKTTEGDPLRVGTVAELPTGLDVVIDCAGHAALSEHGPTILRRGLNMVPVSMGALADAELELPLRAAAREGGAKLHLASGAIGALDALHAARAGRLDRVTYTGRKPPKGWRDSPAEEVVDLEALKTEATHFQGTARDAEMRYPKNANVAAAVALAGLGFDATEVRLIADPTIESNIHEVTAEGDFGQFHFQINGRALPDNPRSSALAAMSVLSKLAQLSQPVTI